MVAKTKDSSIIKNVSKALNAVLFWLEKAWYPNAAIIGK